MPSLGCRLGGLVVVGFPAEGLAVGVFLVDGVMYER